MDKLFNDNVHGHIHIPPLCVKIVDTPEFQRLRNIKQLGMAYLVYPGASHNRFEHSLGVCHLAGQFVDRLNSNRLAGEAEAPVVSAAEKLCVEVAALCHDLGHGPLSHTWERFVDAVERERGEEGDAKWRHEKSSVDMLVALIENNNLKEAFKDYQLHDTEIDFIKELIIGRKTKDSKHPKPFLFQIVANKDNDIDVDKWDYFLRDALYLNTSEMFDCQRLMASVRLVKVDNSWHVCYRDKDAFNVWNMFQVRARLHYQCYQHSVVKCVEEMMTDALCEADRAGFVFQRPNGTSVPLRRAQDDMALWTRLTDHIVHELLYSADEKFETSQSLIERIVRRDIYTLVVKCPIENSAALEAKRKQVADFCRDSDGRFRLSEFRFAQLRLDHGSANQNPFDRIYFYKKQSPDVAETMSITEARLFPDNSCDLLRTDLLLFCTKPKKEITVQELSDLRNLLK